MGVAVANGYLYAIGGQDPPSSNPSYVRFSCVERYDPSKYLIFIVLYCVGPVLLSSDN